MIVKYARSRDYKGALDPLLTMGKLYTVVSILFGGVTQPALISICTDDDNTPSLFDLKYFDVVDGHFPDGWTVRSYENGCAVLQPDQFHGDFWDRYHDGDSDAEKAFSDYWRAVSIEGAG